MTISAAALQRLEQLKSFAMTAAATTEGLRPEVDHWRDQIQRLSIGLSDVRRTYGEVTIGASGEAYIATTRKITQNNHGHRTQTYEPVDERRPDLDGYTLPIFNARQRLEAAREQAAAASARAGELRRVVDEARRALQGLGWRGDR